MWEMILLLPYLWAVTGTEAKGKVFASPKRLPHPALLVFSASNQFCSYCESRLICHFTFFFFFYFF